MNSLIEISRLTKPAKHSRAEVKQHWVWMISGWVILQGISVSDSTVAVVLVQPVLALFCPSGVT
jgi:hypothetical protein